MEQFRNPSINELQVLLRQIKTIAVVGLSPKPSRPSHMVAKSMQQFGYRIFPVRPAVDKILGEQAVPSLYELQERPDLVNVFRAPEHVGPIVDACIELELPAIWLQDGVTNEEAAVRAQQAGITVIMDRCIYRDYLTL